MKRVKLQNNLIYADISILETLKQIDKCPVKVLFITDSEDILIATVTDGDIRRAILNGISLDAKIIEIAQKNCHYITVDSIKEAERICKEKFLSAIPYVDDVRRIQHVFVSESFNVNEEMECIDLPIVIMAGGQGKRLYPYTKILPKPLIPIEDTPICERIIQSFVNIGCKDFLLIVNYKKNMIKSYFSDAEIDANIVFVDEDNPLGTGGGLRLLKNKIFGTFILTNCDIIILEDVREIVRYHKENSNDVTMVCSLKNFEIPYGIVKISEGGELASFEEKPKMSFFTNTGYYILEESVMDYIKENELIGMPDIIDRMKNDGRKIGIYPISEDFWLDMGQFDSMEGMERRLRELS